MIAKICNNNLIIVSDTTQFDVRSIMHSGQVFRYFEHEDSWDLVVGKNYARLQYVQQQVEIHCNDAEFFFEYFDLHTDYNAIKRELGIFKSLQGAIEAGGGIRILRAEFCETVISFIISANNNIKRFTKTLNLLSKGWGELLPNGAYSFPTLSQMSKISEQDFKAIGCGYRSAYLVKAVQQLLDMDVHALQGFSHAQLDKALCSICGVGAKVCACIKLFALHRLDTCPMDTWLKKAIEQIPPHERQVLQEHKYAGVAQQYVFYYLQHLGKSLSV